MKTLLSLFLLLALGASGAVVGTRFSEYPNVAGLTNSELFLVAVTNVMPPTNKNITYGQLRSLLSSNNFVGSFTGDGRNVSNVVAVSAGVATVLVDKWNTSNSGLIVEGDSLMANANGLWYALTNTYPLWLRFGAISNFSMGGSALHHADPAHSLTNRWGSNVAPAISAMKAAGLTNIFLLFDDGANELLNDPNGVCTMWTNYISRAQSSNVTVITLDVLPLANGTVPVMTNWSLLNYVFRGSHLPEYMLEWSRLFPNMSDTNISPDGTHLTSNSYLRAAKSLNSLLLGPAHLSTDSTAQTQYGTNNVVISPSGVLSTLIDGDGRVGIKGPTPPTIAWPFPGDTLDVCGYFKVHSDGTFTWGSPTAYGSSYWDTGLAALGGGTACDFILRANGVEKMRVTTNSTVGIGVTQPENTFQIANYFGAGGGIVRWGGDVRSGSLNNSGLLSFDTGKVLIGSGSANTDVAFITDGSNERAKLLSGGNFGIGYASPPEKLSVSGNISASGAVIATNAFVMPPVATGPDWCTNGLAAIWNSNTTVYIRTSAVGATTFADKLMAP